MAFVKYEIEATPQVEAGLEFYLCHSRSDGITSLRLCTS